jgi:hypothetical protein
MQETAILIDVSNSIYWNGKGASVVGGNLTELKKMLMAAVNAQNTFPEVLSDWLRHDLWTQNEGLILLLGLDPRGTVIEPSNWLGLKKERLDEIVQAKFLDGRYIDFAIWDAVFNHLKLNGIEGIDDKLNENVKHELWGLSESYRNMKSIFESGNFPNRNKPDFYLKWAIEKEFNVPWRKWYENKDKSNITEQKSNKEGLVKCLTKQNIANAFEGIYWSRDKWLKYLASPPIWLESCRDAKGNKKVSATWNPVSIGLALIGRKPPDTSAKISTLSVKMITVTQLDSVFRRLKDWENDWKEKTELER